MIRKPQIDLTEVKSAAIGRWPFILTSLGVSDKYLTNKHSACPSPGCGGTDRFRFDDREGRGTFICNQMDGLSGDGFRLVQHIFNCSFKEALELVSYVVGGVVFPDLPEPEVKAKEVVKQEFTRNDTNNFIQHSDPADGEDIFTKYLASRRCLRTGISPDVRIGIDAHLRCLIRDNHTNLPMSIQSCHIYADGTHSNRMFLKGSVTAGGSIKAIVNTDSKELIIAEGLETALTLSLRFPTANVWSVLNAGNMGNFVVPDWVEKLHIAVDNDKAGWDAYNKLTANVKCNMAGFWSFMQGEDLNDEYRRAGTIGGVKV